jgi:hypothetical protein
MLLTSRFDRLRSINLSTLLRLILVIILLSMDNAMSLALFLITRLFIQFKLISILVDHEYWLSIWSQPIQTYVIDPDLLRVSYIQKLMPSWMIVRLNPSDHHRCHDSYVVV